MGRFGGEEFILLLPHTDIAESSSILEQLCRALRERSDILPHATIHATASFGATTTNGRDLVTGLELLHEADVALYRAKKNGRNQVCFFTRSDETIGPLHPLSRLHLTDR